MLVINKITQLLICCCLISLLVMCEEEPKLEDRFVYDSLASDSIKIKYPKYMRKIDLKYSDVINLLPFDISFEKVRLMNMYFNDDDSSALFVTLYNYRFEARDSIEHYKRLIMLDSNLLKTYVNFKLLDQNKIKLDGKSFILHEYTNDYDTDNTKYRLYEIQARGSFQNKLLAITFMTFEMNRSDSIIKEAHEIISSIRIK